MLVWHERSSPRLIQLVQDLWVLSVACAANEACLPWCSHALPAEHLALRQDLIFTTASASPQPQCLPRSWPPKGAQQILKNLDALEEKGKVCGTPEMF